MRNLSGTSARRHSARWSAMLAAAALPTDLGATSILGVTLTTRMQQQSARELVAVLDAYNPLGTPRHGFTAKFLCRAADGTEVKLFAIASAPAGTAQSRDIAARIGARVFVQPGGLPARTTVRVAFRLRPAVPLQPASCGPAIFDGAW